MIIRLLYIYILLFLLVGGNLFSKGENPIQKSNNISLGSDNNIRILRKDTIKNPDQIYDSIKNKAYRNKITRGIYDLLFKENGESKTYTSTIKSEAAYLRYQGKIIRKIYFKKINLFSSSIDNPNGHKETWIERTSKQFHVQTSNKIILQNLFIKEGDEIAPTFLADNERLLRMLPFIKDARIHVINSLKKSKYVDILVVTQDVWSKGIFGEATSIKTGKIEIFDNNINGIGHQTKGTILFDYNQYPKTGYHEMYAIENIGGHFIRGEINYYNAFRDESYGISFNRDFISPKFIFAGGVKVQEDKLIENIRDESLDTTYLNVPLRRLNQDYWLGKSFRLNSLSSKFSNRSTIVIAGRVIKNKYYVRPQVTQNYNAIYHNKTLYLASVAYSKQKFYKSSLIYSFGRTEDIPYGILTKVTIGKENGEFEIRNYIGSKIAFGGLNNRFGYAYGSIAIGSFYKKEQFEQTVLDLEARLFSRLRYAGSNRIRQFFRIKYTLGLNMNIDDEISLYKKAGVRGLTGEDIFDGLQRLIVNYETISFTRFNPLNFRFAVFGFGDIGLIGPNKTSIFKTDFYSGFGLGVRIRNDNLVFETFQIRLAFYPNIPEGAKGSYINFSGKATQHFHNFYVTAPDIIPFE